MIVDVKNKIGRNNRIIEIINLIQKKDIDISKLEFRDFDDYIYFNIISKNNSKIQFSYQLGFGKLSYLTVLAHGDKFLLSDGFILSKEDARDELNNIEGFESEINYLKSFLSSEITEKKYYYKNKLYKKEFQFNNIVTNEVEEFGNISKIIWPWISNKLIVDTKVYKPWINDKNILLNL